MTTRYDDYDKQSIYEIRFNYYSVKLFIPIPSISSLIFVKN